MGSPERVIRGYKDNAARERRAWPLTRLGIVRQFLHILQLTAALYEFKGPILRKC